MSGYKKQKMYDIPNPHLYKLHLTTCWIHKESRQRLILLLSFLINWSFWEFSPLNSFKNKNNKPYTFNSKENVEEIKDRRNWLNFQDYLSVVNH